MAEETPTIAPTPHETAAGATTTTQHITSEQTPTEASKMQVSHNDFKTLAETDTGKVIGAVIKATAIDTIKHDEEVALQVTEAAKGMIDTAIDTEKIKIQQEQTKAKFDVNKNACRIYGVEDSVPEWQQSFMKWGSYLWFIVYFIIASFTIAPISTFSMKLQVVFKKMWVAILIACVVYVAIVTVPLWAKLGG